jgi:putative PIN family toxin of toxin-antitoxin system
VKVVLDTNVLLAGVATRGLCETVVELCLGGHELFLSQAILDELREHLAGKFKLPEERIQDIVRLLQGQASIVIPVDVSTQACRDSDDLPVLGTAMAAGAQCLVTGDKDLLSIQNFHGCEILTPREFYEKTR